MDWKFWQKKDPGASPAASGSKKLPRPKDLPQEVGRHLVVVGGYSPDWVWNLKGVVRPRENSKNVFDIRIFNPDSAADSNIDVRNYSTLDGHPELIIFAGWYDRESREVQIEKLLEETG